MKRTEIVDCLRRLNEKNLLPAIEKDGPTALVIGLQGKTRYVAMAVTESGDQIKLTIGRFFKRRFVISASEIGGLRA